MGRRPDAEMVQARRRILEMWLQHGYVAEIAEAVGVSTYTIHVCTRKWGLERGSGRVKLLGGRYRWQVLPEPRQTRSGIQLVEAMRDEKGNAPPCSQCPAAGQCAEWIQRKPMVLLPCERPLLPWELSGSKSRRATGGMFLW